MLLVHAKNHLYMSGNLYIDEVGEFNEEVRLLE